MGFIDTEHFIDRIGIMTELFRVGYSTTLLTWDSLGTYTMPAGAGKVFLVAVASTRYGGSTTGGCRISYGGVVRCTADTEILDPHIVTWVGDGLGYSAIVEVEGRGNGASNANMAATASYS